MAQDIINVNLNIADQAVTQIAYNTLLIYANTPQAATVLAYSDLSSMVDDGFSVTSPAYLAATKAFAQSPRIRTVKIGKRSSNFTQLVRLTPVAAVAADVEVLNDGNFTSTTTWAAAAEFAFAGAKAVFTYVATGVGTLTQTVANQQNVALGGQQYVLTYTVSAITGTPTATLTSAFAATAQTLDVATPGIKTLTFTSSTTPGNFVISATGVALDTFSLDDLSLRLVSDTTYTVAIDGVDVTYNTTGAESLATIITGLAAEITASGNGITAASAGAGTYITLTNNSVGAVHSYSGLTDNLSIADFTANSPSVALDLSAIQLYDDDWYGLVLDSNGNAEVLAAAAWAEANAKLFFADVSGVGVLNPASTTDLLYQLDALGYNRTVAFVRKTLGGEWASAGLAGKGLPYIPGSITWAHKQLAGVATEQFTDTEIATIVAKHGNYYMQRWGLGDFMEGWAVSGRYIDVTHGADKLVSDIQASLFQLLASVIKVPYTDPGISLIDGKIREVLNLAVQNGFLAANPAPTVVVPLAIDCSSADKAARILRNVKVGAVLAGAIHRIDLDLTLSL